ncbi:alcohol dehydrogenase catalytic domain-containing protein [Ruegeria sp. SCSIO 43209]|uniref:alcohol dehydrogenase catalytic domain-containing protein n=1 Tax=Ruegeria sp. SCSIO 43209 TaxID=2793010 RepID=UPI001CA95A84|nr:alcohol dehydrogenase catalytic domain-containing protein [Ruegeria sp. SCSIO 43209]UAB87892.1 alcohol dehydrogenase catalytic domain-containing protein [Ruegeria sp. SCSIO 43209]
MKALVYTDVETLEYRKFANPEPGPDEVLVRIDSVGICGSDMHAYLGHDDRRPAPLILGHEGAGVTADGRRVTINPLVNDPNSAASRSGRENLCPSRQIISMPPREGAFAEYVAIPERNLIEVPSHITLEQAALAEPIAVSWHAVRLGLASLHPADERRAHVIGGGAIGLAAALALTAMGVEQVTLSEPNAARATYLRDTCGIAVVDTPEQDIPLVIDAVGFSSTRAVASALVSPGGVILHIGLGSSEGGLDIRRITLQEITLIGTYTYTAQDFRDTCNAMFNGRLGTLDWVETRDLSDGAAAFTDIRAGKTLAPKTILKP